MPASGDADDASAVLEACLAVSSIGRGLPTVVVMPDGPARLSPLTTLTGLVWAALSPEILPSRPDVCCMASATAAMGALVVVDGLAGEAEVDDGSTLLTAFCDPINVPKTSEAGFTDVWAESGDFDFCLDSAKAAAAVIGGDSSLGRLPGLEDGSKSRVSTLAPLLGTLAGGSAVWVLVVGAVIEIGSAIN